MIFHVGLDISGALKKPKDWVGCISCDGRTLWTVKEVREFFEFHQALGRKVLPLSKDCDGFDYITGCPGHPEREDDKT